MRTVDTIESHPRRGISRKSSPTATSPASTWNGEVKGTVVTVLRDARASLMQPVKSLKSAARPETPASVLNRSHVQRRLHSLPSLAHIPPIEISTNAISSRGNRPRTQPTTSTIPLHKPKLTTSSISHPSSSRQNVSTSFDVGPLMSISEAIAALQDTVSSDWNEDSPLSALQHLCSVSATTQITPDAVEISIILLEYLQKHSLPSEILEVSEAVTYAAATIINLFSNEETINALLVEVDQIITIVGEAIHNCSLVISNHTEKLKENSMHGYICAELLVVIRHLARSDIWVEFSQSTICLLLERFCSVCSILHRSDLNSNLIPNLARAVSALSTHSECVERFANDDNVLQGFLWCLATCQNKIATCTRLCYALANITAEDPSKGPILANLIVPGLDQSSAVSSEHPSTTTGLTMLMALLSRASKREIKTKTQYLQCTYADQVSGTVSDSKSRSTTKISSNPTLLLKLREENIELTSHLLRLLANIALDSDLAVSMSTSNYASCTLSILQSGISEDGIDSFAYKNANEYRLHAVTFLNHCAYHTISTTLNENESDPCAPLSLCQIGDRELVAAIIPYLFSVAISTRAECTRLIANLSRHAVFAQLFVEARVFETIIMLLESNCFPVVYSSCGTLLNIAHHSQSPTSKRIFKYPNDKLFEKPLLQKLCSMWTNVITGAAYWTSETAQEMDGKLIEEEIFALLSLLAKLFCNLSEESTESFPQWFRRRIGRRLHLSLNQFQCECDCEVKSLIQYLESALKE